MLRVGASRYYQKLMQSRFENLEISKDLIAQVETELGNEKTFLNAKTTPLETCLELAKSEEVRHLFITGESGMGKTTSLLKVWENGLSASDWNQPIPIYVALAEYNTSRHKEEFIFHTIATNYLGKKRPTDDDFNIIWDVIKHPHSNEPYQPSIYLLLDGIDEISADSLGLLSEIKNIVEEGKGAQIVVTSHTEFFFSWMKNFHTIPLQKLTKEQITSFLEALGVAVPSNKELLDFIKTPMVLTLYATSSSMTNQYMGDDRLQFRHSITSYSDLVWNFTESMMAQRSQDLSPIQFQYMKFMLRHFIPYIGFYMAKMSKQVLSEDELIMAINESSSYLYQKQFLKSFPDFIPSFRMFNIISEDWLGELERYERKARFITKQLHLMAREEHDGQMFFFFRQSQYRDFFAAVHVYNDLKLSKHTGTLPHSLSHFKLSGYNQVGQYIGELCDEENNTADALVVRRTWKQTSETLLSATLEHCRGKFNEESTKHVVWNVLTIWKRIRKHFASTNLKALDLQEFLFDELPLRHFRKYPIYPAKLNGSLVHENNFISQGHTKGVNAVAYSPDGKKILSASIDHTIKEWSVSSGKCIQTLEGHTDVVKCLAYNSDGTKALSGSDDKTIIEWDLEKGKDIETFKGHNGAITTLLYWQNDEKILSGALDKTVKLWDVKSNKCLNTYSKFDGAVVKIAIHPNGKQFAAASREKVFQEWYIETGETIQIYIGHQLPVESLDYNKDGSRLVSSSYDSTIKEWDTKTSDCTQTLKGHLGSSDTSDVHAKQRRRDFV